MTNTVNLSYKQQIDNAINKYDKYIINSVYSNQTEETLEKRKNQHIKNHPKFKGMQIRKVYKTTNENDKKYIKDAETYLIRKLKEKYGKKCLNIQNTGGAGENHTKGDFHKIYIMFK
jgi:RNase P/RNase MRP subunit p30